MLNNFKLSLFNKFKAFSLSRELKASWAFVERQFNLSRRYLAWEIVFLFYSVINTLTIGLIAVGMDKDGKHVQEDFVIYLIIGALMWGYLSVIFREVSDSIAWERWEGTIEQTFMAPIHRLTHLGGICVYSIMYGVIRTIIILFAASLFFGVQMENANYAGALLVLLASSASFLGLGLIAAVFPMLSPEKGAQATHIMEGLLLLISGIYYPISALPEWLQPFSALSPATYTLEGVRKAILEGASTMELMPYVGNVILIAVITIPVGMLIFTYGETYAKKAGLLKRNG